MRERLFSVEQANALIPRLEMVIAKLQGHARVLRAELDDIAGLLGCPAASVTPAQVLEMRPQLEPLLHEVDALSKEIETCGGILKGVELGLVDFPAEIDGTRVFLCWQYGEREVGHFHTLDGGFAGRKPLAGSTLTYLQ